MDSGSVIKDFSDKNKQEVLDFMDGVKTDYTGQIQVCTIIDLYLEKSAVEEKRDKVIEFIKKGDKSEPNYMRFLYEYIESEQKGRITLFGPLNYLIESMRILQ